MSQLRRWAFTWNGDFDVEECKRVLDKNCSRWVFQEEKGEESGRRHLQGRCSFKNPKRLDECSKVIRGCHWTPEHDSKAGDFYCTKEETRVGEVWSDKDKQNPLPWDLARITEWRQWQLDIFDSLNTLDDRVINVLVDKKGGIGKSKVFKFACWKNWAGLIPTVGDAKDIIQACCSMGEKKAYILDLPRSGESDIHMRSIWKAIEQIKNGIVIDLRYNFKQIIMGCPVIWVFTNELPNTGSLSKDRWKLWSVKEDGLRPL